MYKKTYIICYMLLVALYSGCGENWDFYGEDDLNYGINDLMGTTMGYRLELPINDATVDEAQVGMEIIHDMPSNLEIRMIHDNDTIILWENDYPGGEQIADLEAFINTPVNGTWDLSIFDGVADGNEGSLVKFSLGINYTDGPN